MTSIIVASNQEAAGRGHRDVRPAQPCATRDSAQINSKRGRATVSRNSAAYQPLRMRAGGSDDRALNRGGIVANVKFLPAIQSAHASRAVTAGVSSVISAPLRLFQFFGAFTALRAVFSVGFHRALTVRQDTARKFANPRHVSILSAGTTGLVAHSDGHRDSERKIGNVRKAGGEIRNVEC